MAEENNSWAFLEGLASQVVEVGGEALKAKYTPPPTNDPQPPVQQTVTTVPGDASDRGQVTYENGNFRLEQWQLIGLAVAAFLAFVLVIKK